MANYITNIKASLLEGISSVDITLDSGVNFISGENGTGKSKLLEFIKINSSNPSLVAPNGSSPIDASRIAFYNPKRNSQKKDVVGLLQQLQREGQTKQGVISKLNQSYAEQFVDYPTTSDLFVTSVNDVVFSKSRTPNYAVNSVKKDFEKVIKAVLPYFEVEAYWDKLSQQPHLMFKKYNHAITPSQLSVGENEIFSLTFSIYSSKENFDIYIIDEPETHLNWSLEKNLFDFLDDFSKKEGKQLIIVTHSPVVFENKYVDKTYFFRWESDKIISSKTPTKELMDNLASRVANTFVKLDDSFDKTFFVEDLAQKYVIDSLSVLKSKNNQVIIVGDKKRVVHLHQTLKDTLSNAFFVVDGDNDDYNNAKFSGTLFALKKYCIENYFLDRSILLSISKVSDYKTEDDLEEHIIKKVKSSRNPEFKKRYLAEIKLAGLNKKTFFEIIDHMDGAQFISENLKLYEDLGYPNLKSFIDAYVQEAKKQKKMKKLFGEITEKFK